jgi:hypothetical protein
LRRSSVTSIDALICVTATNTTAAVPTHTAERINFCRTAMPGGSQTAARGANGNHHAGDEAHREKPLLEGANDLGQRQMGEPFEPAGAACDGEIEHPGADGERQRHNCGRVAAFGDRCGEESYRADQQAVERMA